MKTITSLMPSIVSLFNNDMQYLLECSEKIVMDNPKS